MVVAVNFRLQLYLIGDQAPAALRSSLPLALLLILAAHEALYS